MPPGVTFDVPVRLTKTVTPADPPAAANCIGAVGIHNASAVAGLVKVSYSVASAGSVFDTIYLPAGGTFRAQIDRVWATPAPPGNICALFA